MLVKPLITLKKLDKIKIVTLMNLHMLSREGQFGLEFCRVLGGGIVPGI